MPVQVPAPPQEPRPRRRVRVAYATLRRTQRQHERFVTDYGRAASAQERFAVVANALRAAAAPGSHQPDEAEVARRLDQLTSEMTSLLAQLHEQQQAHANQIIRADQRRIDRNERRRRQ